MVGDGFLIADHDEVEDRLCISNDVGVPVVSCALFFVAEFWRQQELRVITDASGVRRRGVSP